MILTEIQIKDRISQLGDFYHNISLPFGIQSRPGYSPARGDNFQLLLEALPESMEGFTVLDLGCNAGVFSIEAKKLGASRVVGVDYSEQYIRQANFCAEVLELDIEYIQSDVGTYLQDILRKDQRFDFVFFVGTLYHLTDPIAVPKAIGRICNQSCLVETVGVLPELRKLDYNLLQLPRPQITHSGTVWMNMAALHHIFLDLSGFTSAKELFNGSRISALYTK